MTCCKIVQEAAFDGSTNGNGVERRCDFRTAVAKGSGQGWDRSTHTTSLKGKKKSMSDVHALKRFVSVVAILASSALWSGVQAQTMGDIVAEAGVEWLIGNWVEEGRPSTRVTFEWLLDKHAISVGFDADSVKARGIIIYRAHTNEVLYFAADNGGATGEGEWILRSGHPTLLYKQIRKNGNENNAGFVHKRIDDNTMLIEVYELDDEGEISGTPLSSPKFVRK